MKCIFYLDLFLVLWLQQNSPLTGEVHGIMIQSVPVEQQMNQDLLVMLQYS